MANMFNEDGTYNKTEWKAGDKITAVKLNKIELSLEAINNNDITRHVEADNRLDILEERMANTPDNEQMDALEDMVKYNKDAADLAVYSINQKIESLEGVNADSRLDALESVNAGGRLGALEGVNADSRLYALEDYTDNMSKLNIRTPQYYGASGDGYTDDSTALSDAIKDCASNGYVLFLNGKYRIQKSIVYEAWRPITIIGSRGTYPSLTSEEFNRSGESFDIYLDTDVVFEIGKFGNATFLNVGFASTSKTTGGSIIVRSFRNKFMQCSFSQMHTAIHIKPSTTGNWTGENQILYSQFSKCTYAIYSDNGVNSDSEIIGNLFHGTCDTSFYGSCPGYTFSLNHFYGLHTPNVFKYFNTKIVNNYIQESYSDNPCFILDGSFGCMVHDNNFELNEPANTRDNKKGLIGIKTGSGCGNISINGNSVHGKSNVAVKNLAFIDILYEDVMHDMPITIGVNNTRCCEALFKEGYPLYNINGTLNVSDYSVNALGGNISNQSVDVVGGIAYFYVEMDKIPSYENLFKVNNYGGFPFQYTMIQTTTSGTTKIFTGISNDGTIKATNYGELKSVKVSGSYIIHHRANMKITL